MAATLTKAGDEGSVARHVAGVAARLFAARGYDATPVRAIVEAAGVTKPTLYYHFGSKEGLAQALLTVPLTRLAERMRAIVEGPGDPVEDLAEVMEAQFDFCRDDPDRARFVYALLFGPLGSSLSAELMRCAQLGSLVDAAVRRLAAAGVIDEERVGECAAAVRGLVVIYTMDFLYRGMDLGPDLARRLVGDLLGGFAKAGRGRENGA
jgi:AcrR family transcriptional regulator